MRPPAIWRNLPDSQKDWAPYLLLIGVLALSSFALRSYLHINSDVAFMMWAANEVLGTPVYGVDVLDVNPPLCLLIYMPAVLIAPIVGFEWGIRLWMLFVSILSVTVLWQTADRTIRLPVAISLVLFVTLAYPNHFAQREQIALLLCAPYVAGAGHRKGWGIVSGVMAGVGFLIKPHFLIPLALIFALRRRIGTEERAIVSVGAIYGVILLLFFQPYLFEMIPRAAVTYWAIGFPWRENALQSAVILLSALPLAAAAAPHPPARPYLMATVGFCLAALLQNKGFYYHYIPSFGFLIMFLATSMFNQRRLIAVMAAMFLLMQIVYQGRMIERWISHYAELISIERDIQAEIDSSASYASLVDQVFPAFPAAIYSPSRFVGIAICQMFIPAVARYELGLATGNPEKAQQLALEQVMRELRRKPELVIVAPSEYDGKYFDALEWYKKDEGFRELWKDYAAYRTFHRFTFYRRK